MVDQTLGVFERNAESCISNRSGIPALKSMLVQPLPESPRLIVTETALASADRRWRDEMRKAYGPDAVLVYGYAPEGQGGLGTPLRRSFEARRVAVTLWRQERRLAVR